MRTLTHQRTHQTSTRVCTQVPPSIGPSGCISFHHARFNFSRSLKLLDLYVCLAHFFVSLPCSLFSLLSNCVVEIYGLDPVLAYQHAFVYIRQLAIHLRQALLVKKKDAHRAVYNWNFVNCLRVWAKVLAVHGVASTASNGAVAASDNLQALVYPFVQICLGTLTVLPSSRYFPLRFHVVRMLIDLCARCSIFVPLAPFLLGVLHAPELARKPTSSTRKVNDIHYVLKASKHIIATKTYQEAVVSEALHLLLQYFNLFATSIAFNELILPTVKILRKAAKEAIVIHRVRKQVQGFVLKLEHNASWIATKRNACNWAPKDMMEAKRGVDGLHTFDAEVNSSKGPASGAQQSPLAKYVAVALEERKMLDDSKADWDGSKGSRKEPTKKAAKKAANNSDDDDEDEDDKYDRKKKAQQGDEDDEGEEEEDDEGEDEEDEEDDGSDDDADEEEDGQPRKKKSKAANGAAASKPARPAFEYPADMDADMDADGAQGDMLQELAFSDDDDEEDNKPRKKQTKQPQQQKQKQTKQAPKQQQPQKKKQQQSPASKSVKKEGGQQQQQSKKQSGGKPAASPAGQKRKRV